MNCYNHPAISAVGICKNCNKGLCPECLTEVKNGIACTSTCVEEVEALNNLINKNKSLSKRAAGSHYRAAFLYFGMGIIFFYAIIVYPDMKFYMLPVGGLFLFMSILTFVSARKYKNVG